MKKAALIIMIISLFMFSACSNTNKLKTGRYICGEASSLFLEDGNKFVLNGPLYISAALVGSYTAKDNKLILAASDEKKYIFLIENGTLVFESGEWLEHWVEPGATFYLSEE